MPSFLFCEAATRDYHYSAAYVPIPVCMYILKIIIALQRCYRSSTIFDLLDITDLRSCYAHSLHVTIPETFVCIVEGLSFGSLIYLSAPYLPPLLEITFSEVSYHILIPYLHNSPSLATPRFDCLYYHSQTPPSSHYLHLATDNLLDCLSL